MVKLKRMQPRPVLVLVVYLVVQSYVGWAGDRAASSGGGAPAQESATSALSRYRLDRPPRDSEKLPKVLREISGLAVTPDGRVLAHDDERGVVFEVDSSKGKIVKSFQLGEDGVAADFEGIAVSDSALYLVTSAGALYQTVEGADGESVAYDVIDSQAGDACEVEGLAFDPIERMLLLACKTTRGMEFEGFVTVFRWSIEASRLAVPATLKIAKADVRRALSLDDFHPSGIAVHPETQHFFILSARERAILEVTQEGVLVDSVVLKPKWHAHAEGIEFAPVGGGRYELLISDEGDDHRARVARYRVRKSRDRRVGAE